MAVVASRAVPARADQEIRETTCATHGRWPARGARDDVEHARPSSGREARWTGDRVASLIAVMTLDEKLAQLVGLWMGVDTGNGDVVAPAAGRDAAPTWGSFEELRPARAGPADPPVRHRTGRAGRGRRPGGPVPALAERRDPARHPRPGARGVPDRASPPGARRPTPCRSPGARPSTPTSSPRWAQQIGASMRRLGVHQGLAPVLDVVSDARWGRVEECISEDPYVVGGRHRLRPRPAEHRGRRDAQALRRLLHLARRPQPRARAHRARGAGRRRCCRRSRWPCSTAARTA